LTKALDRSLSDQPTDAEMFRIIENFGTHAIKSIEMGAKYISKSQWSSTETGSSDSETTTTGQSFDVGGGPLSANASFDQTNTDSSS